MESWILTQAYKVHQEMQTSFLFDPLLNKVFLPHLGDQKDHQREKFQEERLRFRLGGMKADGNGLTLQLRLLKMKETLKIMALGHNIHHVVTPFMPRCNIWFSSKTICFDSFIPSTDLFWEIGGPVTIIVRLRSQDACTLTMISGCFHFYILVYCCIEYPTLFF